MVQEGRGGREAAAADQPEIRDDIEAIKADIAALRAEVANLIQDMLNVGKVQAGDAGERLAEAARSRLDQLGSAWGETADRGRQVLDSLRHQVEERPLTSIAVAFGAGTLLGCVLKR